MIRVRMKWLWVQVSGSCSTILKCGSRILCLPMNFSFIKWLQKKEELDEVANVCFITPNVLVLFCLFVFPFINVRWCEVGQKTWVKLLKLSEVSLGRWSRKNTSVQYKLLKLQFISHTNKCYVDRMMFDSMIDG